ncbi:peptidoglycan editing factor PgeF [Orbus sturtevantii]|uniref:peptidoglycan editing factor PgeF n=1 Tax=Orbus sturtevantii TaxID=3074109 RepID=UPI00370D8FDB
MLKAVYPNWPAPDNIRALTTTRQGGRSTAPYHSLNLASHVGDDLNHIIENRMLVKQSEGLPSEPIWLNQIHSTKVIDLANYHSVDADGSYSQQKKVISAVLTADCLPVLFCSQQGDEIAAAHAGWRGLCQGILENSVRHFKCQPSQIMAWLGPAIGPLKFEVGAEVKAQFEFYDSEASNAFQLVEQTQQKYLADLYLLARQRLTKLGLQHIYGGEHCTYSESELFYSYRRQSQTGRMASLIWFE